MDAYQQIGESLPLLSKYQALCQSNQSMEEALALIYKDILEFHKKALRYFRHRSKSIKGTYIICSNLTSTAWRQLFHATWKTFQTEFSALLGKVRWHGRLVESHANLVEFAKLYHQGEIQQATAEAEIQRQKQEEGRNRRIAVQQWLSAASADADQEKGVTTREGNPGSGRWLLGNNQVQGWLSSDFCSAPVLWVNGIPGAG